MPEKPGVLRYSQYSTADFFLGNFEASLELSSQWLDSGAWGGYLSTAASTPLLLSVWLLLHGIAEGIPAGSARSNYCTELGGVMSRPRDLIVTSSFLLT
jgi:hypothetical protein